MWLWSIRASSHAKTLRSLARTYISIRQFQGRCRMSIDLSLDRIRKLASHLPPYTRPTCHITGTNGKGSVSALLTSIFRSAELTQDVVVGRFNSPHLVSVHDSITLNDVPVSSDLYAAARSRVVQADTDHAIGASNFELLTCTALNIFETVGVDVVVLEGGMGGRLDATNVIPDEAVLVSAMTAVDLDHQAFLGGTVAAIAREKAAIARCGRPFVLGKQIHDEVEPIVQDVIEQTGAHLLAAPTIKRRAWDEGLDGPHPLANHIPPPPTPVLAYVPCFGAPIQALLPLQGEHQLGNLAVALGIVSAVRTHASIRLPWIDRITPENIVRGIKDAQWSGRLSWHTMPGLVGPILVDGAHNAASAKTLAAYIASLSRDDQPLRLTYLLALSSSPPKTPTQTLAPLFSLNADIGVAPLPFSPPEGMPWVRHESRSALVASIRELAPDAVVWGGEGHDESQIAPAQLRSALDWAARRQEEKGGLIVIAGSLYLVADFYRLLVETE